MRFADDRAARWVADEGHGGASGEGDAVVRKNDGNRAQRVSGRRGYLVTCWQVPCLAVLSFTGARLSAGGPDVAGAGACAAAGYSAFAIIRFDAYRPTLVPQPNLANSARIDTLIKNGVLELSLKDAIQLALENNLDLAIARYNFPIAQADILRTQAGGSFRGVNTGVVQNTPGGGAGGFGSGAGGAGAGRNIGWRRRCGRGRFGTGAVDAGYRNKRLFVRSFD